MPSKKEEINRRIEELMNPSAEYQRDDIRLQDAFSLWEPSHLPAAFSISFGNIAAIKRFLKAAELQTLLIRQLTPETQVQTRLDLIEEELTKIKNLLPEWKTQE